MREPSGRPCPGFWGESDESETLDRYRMLVHVVDDGLFQLDAEGRFVGVNEGTVELTGYSREELLGAPISTIFADRTIEYVETHLQGRDARETDTMLTVAVEMSDGDTVPCELRLSTPNPSGGLDGAVGVIRDRPDAEERPWRAGPDEVIASMFEEADVGVFLLDDEFEVVWIDETIERYFGLDRSEVLGRSKHDLIETTVADRVADGDFFTDTVFATYEDNTYLEQFECRVTPGDGRKERWLEHRSEPIESGPYAGGRIEFYYDVTDRKEAERARRDRGQQFRSLVHAVEEYAIFMLDPDGYVVTWNRGAEMIKGYEREDILGEHVSVFYTAEDVSDGVPERNLTTAASAGFIEEEGWRVRNDGSRFWANVTMTAIYDDEGTHEGYAKVTRDMTEQREHEALRRRERQLERHRAYTNDILNAIDDVFYVLDEDGSLRRWNDSLSDVTGYSDDEIEAMHTLEFFDEDDQPMIADSITRGVETGSVEVEAEVLTKNGVSVPYAFVASTLDDPDGNTVLAGIGRDVTERKRRVAELERRADQQRVVADLGQFALETDDLDDFMHEAVRQVAEVLDNEYCKVLDLDSDTEELLLRNGVGWEDGIVGEATVSAVESDSQAAYTLANDHPIVVEDLETEARFSGPSLLTSHDVRSGVSTIIGPFDDPWGILGTHDTDRRTFTDEDVTFVQSVANVLAEAIERRQYQRELEQLIADLEESNERLEQFAYAASHDLQEPLRMVSSYLQLIERRYRDELDEDGREFLGFAVDGADRMRAMIDGLLRYSRVETAGKPPSRVDLNEVIETVCNDLSVQIDERDAEITVGELPHVRGDEHQLQQVFQNLLRNAIEYSGEEPPRVHVTADRHESEWTVSVEDEGIGIDPDEHERIFEVFQRLPSRKDRTGSGIGLALCERIVERHGGEIWVDSKPGEGATFSFTLPRWRTPNG